jgi:alpha-tubulin suppressor-like RCC1 family protein
VLGIAHMFDANDPVRIPHLRNLVSFALAAEHGAGIDSAGMLYTWGTGYNGELGDDAVAVR